ncbi:hypothetical protein ANCCAN_02397 [Ancylostoma caninum]|uniref:SWIM-type domain-containing protein n=1 Tax=Ancylostoma caninum TaxID=29170 RepID=A0A368H4C2_ANCCA|nr:hypothetical protein ANCCAN_02397 [Ancylostoma caninum]
MLIKSPDELAASYFIMDRRKLARPFRVRGCNAAHRTAVKNYDSNKQCIASVGESEGEVVAATSKKTLQVQMNAAPCDCDSKENIHCNACGVCPYRFTCSCAGAQKSGISCAHQNAVMMYGNVCFEDGTQRLEVERRPESEDVLDHLVSEAPQTDGSESESRMAEAVRSRDARIGQWRSVQMSYSVIDDKIRRLVKMDTEMEKLIAIVARIKTVENFAIARDEPQSSLPSRPEMGRRGAKPQLTTIRMDTALCNESKQRRSRSRLHRSVCVQTFAAFAGFACCRTRSFQNTWILKSSTHKPPNDSDAIMTVVESGCMQVEAEVCRAEFAPPVNKDIMWLAFLVISRKYFGID